MFYNDVFLLINSTKV